MTRPHPRRAGRIATLRTENLGLPPALAAALATAIEPGSDVYLVGGYVRDRLLGRPARDADLAVAGPPRRVAGRLAVATGGHVFPLSPEHSVWRVTLPAPVLDVEYLDITPLRGDIVADLGERDFTVNAVAASPDGSGVVDPFGGIADLERRRLRLVSAAAIAADPIRALRAVRHAVELGLEIEGATAAQLRRDAALVAGTAGERQRDEVMRAFDTPRAADAVRLMDGLGLLASVLPELEPARTCEQPKEHYWNVFDHSVETVAVLDCLLAVDAAAAACVERRAALVGAWPDWPAARWQERLGENRTRRAVLKLIGLLHDVSKPETRSVERDGRVRFFGHPERGAAVAAEIFRRLRFSAREVKLAEVLVENHLRPGQLAAPGEVPTARALYRLFRELGDDVVDLLALNLADGAAAAGPRQTAAQWRAHVAYTGWILKQRVERTELTQPRRLLTGHDLMAELHLPPGPEIGRLLEALAEAEAVGEVTTRDEALAFARGLHSPDP
jgi:poly(A) polymerase